MKIEAEEDKMTFSGLALFSKNIAIEIKEAVKKEMIKRIMAEFTIKDEVKELKKTIADLSQGKCPYCKAFIRGYKAPIGSFAPEAWATLRENGIDPATGHLKNCSHKEIKT